MGWAADRARSIFLVYIGIAACLLSGRLVVGSKPLGQWFMASGMAVFFAVFGFFAIWLIIGVQVELRGMNTVVRGACSFFFYLFAFCAVWSVAVAGPHPEYWATGAVACLGWSLGALRTYVRYRDTPPKGVRRNLTTG